MGLFLPLMLQAQSLKETVGRDMLIGVAVNQWQVMGRPQQAKDIVRQHFNQLVAENCMKAQPLQPREGEFYWAAADSLVAFAEDCGASLTGHCLVWHSQAPGWFFRENGERVSRETLIRRMQTHIRTVCQHFRGKVIGWDVVNEAIEDDGSWRHTPYYDIIGPEFIEIAFRTAHEADPDAELYYNDYSMANPRKRAAVCRLVRDLKAKGIRIDAVGMQSHCGLDHPNLSAYEASIDSFAACGVKVMVTELDVDVLPAPKGFSGAEISQNFEARKQLNPWPEALPDSVNEQFEQRYLDLFRIYHRHRHQLSRITLWGISDRETWLNGFPVRGRTNYPLFFDRRYNEKPIVKKINELWTSL